MVIFIQIDSNKVLQINAQVNPEKKIRRFAVKQRKIRMFRVWNTRCVPAHRFFLESRDG